MSVTEHPDLVKDRQRIHDDACADQDAGTDEDARRDLVKLVFDIIDDDRVSGVVAALKSGHKIVSVRDHVDNFALSFIPELGTGDNCKHSGKITVISHMNLSE